MAGREGPLVATTHNVLRVIAAFLFWQHGAQKLLGWFGGVGGEPGATAALFSLHGLAGILEFFGGILLAVGLFTRPVAFVLAGEMAVAYFYAHATQGFWPVENRGELAALYCFLFLFLFAYGPGRFSLDALRKRGTPPVTPRFVRGEGGGEDRAGAPAPSGDPGQGRPVYPGEAGAPGQGGDPGRVG